MSSVSLSSLEQLRSTLIRRGIPAGYAHRVSSELHDHAEDLAADSDGTDRQLGDVSQLADEITCTYRRRTFAGRHPWLMFVLLPFPLTILAFSGTLIAYFGSIMLFTKWFLDPSSIVEGKLADTFRIAAILLPAASCAGVAWIICRFARRAGYRWRYALLSCLPIFLFACHTYSRFRIDATGESHGRYMFGFFLPFVELQNNRVMYGWQQLAQAVVPMLVIVWMMAREQRKRRPFVELESA